MSQELRKDFITGAGNSLAVAQALYTRARQDNDGQSFLISGDFMNMGGLNMALGRKAGNDFLKLVAGIYDEECTALSPTDFYALRQDGDEMTFMVRGVDAQALHHALEKAQRRVSDFVEKSGLGNLRHQKYGHLSGAGFFTAVKNIHECADSFADACGDLQAEITHQKKSLPPASTIIRDVTDYTNISSLERFNTALAQTAWNNAGITGMRLPDDLAIDATPSVSDIKGRDERMRDVRELTTTDAATIMRCDLYNLGGLNATLGTVGADHIIQHMTHIAQEETLKAAPDARFYTAGAGVTDVLFVNRDETFATEIKKNIHQRIYTEILSKSISDYASENAFSAAGDTLIGQIAYKDGSHKAVGLVLSHLLLARDTNPSEAFARLDSISHIQKMHTTSFLERTDDGHFRRYNLFPVGKSIHEYDVIENIDPDTPNALPYAHSLKFSLAAKMVMDVFEKPCGVICQEVFGIDLNPVIQRQGAIQDLIKGGIPADTIADKTDSLIQFDFWRKSQKQDLKPVDIQGRANTHVSPDPRLMTFSLARRWNVLPENMHNLPETILIAQAALRTNHELSINTPGIPAIDSLLFLEKDIRIHVAKEKDPSLRRMQACEQALRALEHTRNTLGAADTENILAASATLVRTALDDVSARFEKSGEGYIAHVFSEIRHNPDMPFNQHADINQPETVLHQALQTAAIQLTQNKDLPAGQIEKAVQNIRALQSALVPPKPLAADTVFQPPVSAS